MRFSLKSVLSINAASLTFFTILLVVILFHVGIPILDLIELKTYDLRFLSRGHLQPSPVVALALIDEKSLDKEIFQTRIDRVMPSLKDWAEAKGASS